MKYAVILTHSTGHAVRAERLLKSSGIDVKLIPVPRHISSDCGSAVRIGEEDRRRTEEILMENGAPFDRIESI